MDALIYKIFKDYGISPNWLYVLTYGDVHYFNDMAVVATILDRDGVLIVNSAAVDDKLPTKALRYIKTLMDENSSIVIHSTNRTVIDKLTGKYGFSYDYNTEALYRGLG